jgi:DnaJ like chaperone protein
MKYIGKLIGAFLGWLLTRHPIGIALGLALGHAYDEGLMRGLFKDLLPALPERAALQDPLFALAGAVAKSDGRVSEREIAVAEALMQRMGLNPGQRQRAISKFHSGKEPDFDLHAAARALRLFCGFDGQLKLVMLDVLADVGTADGVLSAECEQVLERIARTLDTTEADFRAIIARKRGQGRSDPYEVLGLTSKASDQEIRDAYRRLIGQHHPDKQPASATPEERERAEQRAREINAAYEQLKSLRGM